MSAWAGIDVGGRRKGFHAAVIDARGVIAGPVPLAQPETVSTWLRPHAPTVVAVDSPRSAAEDGSASRACERRLARELCGIRFTPGRADIAANPYYEWIANGLELYEALDDGPWEVVECFPTASWTRWAGPRLGTRAAWTTQALRSLDLGGVPAGLNQDGRDAIAAAVTARLHHEGSTEVFGEIVVPSAR